MQRSPKVIESLAWLEIAIINKHRLAIANQQLIKLVKVVWETIEHGTGGCSTYVDIYKPIENPKGFWKV